MAEITQDAIARELGVDQAAVSRLERGCVPDGPRADEMKRAYAKVLGFEAVVIFPELLGMSEEGGRK